MLLSLRHRLSDGPWNKKMKLILTLLAASLASAAAFTTVDLTPIVNSDIADYTSGFAYPAPGILDFFGTPFLLADTGRGTIGVVGGLASVGTPASYSVAVNITGATEMRFIANSAYGICGEVVGDIGATGPGVSSGTSLQMGSNLRDHFGGGSFCNDAPARIGGFDFGFDARFDVYSIALDPTKTYTSVNFNTYGMDQLGEPMLAAVTFVNPIPEPSTWMLIGAGTAALGLLRRRL